MNSIKDKKAVLAVVKFQVPAVKATPAPPVGSQIGKYGINITKFCKEFNDKTANIEPNAPVPVVLTIYVDKNFTFVTKSLPVSYLLKKVVQVKGSKKYAAQSDLEHIYKQKILNLTAHTKEAAYRSLIGTAKSMGVEIKQDIENE
jgi:large subunit ribosomal protein L11